MWATTNQDLIGSACEYANSPVNSLTDPVLPSYLRTGYHCAIGEEFGKGAHCGECYRLTSMNNNGRHGTPGSVGSAVVMVSNSGAGGSKHFDCILNSFQAITGATSGVFDIDYEQTACTDVSGVPVIIQWADQNAYYCKMMFENIGGWGSLHSVRACLDGSKCKSLQRFSGQTWTGCPTGHASSVSFTLTQQAPSGELSSITCECSVGSWPWPTGQRCDCPANFVTSGVDDKSDTRGDDNDSPDTGGNSPSCAVATADCRSSKCCQDSGLVCYEKNAFYATCKASCTPGIDPKDPVQFQTPWSCAVLGTVAVQSGDTVFLRTHAGTGNFLDIEGQAVQARWGDRGDWQALVIEKNGGGDIHSGDTVFLTAHTGARVDVDGEYVRARWSEKGAWQSLVVEKSGGGKILPNDVVCFKAHTGKHIDIADSAAHARWDDCGFWQQMRIVREDAGALMSGQSVRLLAHTGKNIDVQGNSVQARWKENGLWQTFKIDNGARRIYSGDTVFLTAHTGKTLDVESTLVQARYDDRGGWQKLIVEKEAGGPVYPGDTIYLKAHTGLFFDVQGDAVQARWSERGAWQALTIEAGIGRRLETLLEADAAKHPAMTNASPTVNLFAIPFGLALGLVLGWILMWVFFALKQRWIHCPLLSSQCNKPLVAKRPDKISPALEPMADQQ